METTATVTHVRLENPGLQCRVLISGPDGLATATVAVRIRETVRGDEVERIECITARHLTDEQERAAIEAVSQSYVVELAVKGETP